MQAQPDLTNHGQKSTQGYPKEDFAPTDWPEILFLFTSTVITPDRPSWRTRTRARYRSTWMTAMGALTAHSCILDVD